MPQIIQRKQNNTLPQITYKINTNRVPAATAQAKKPFQKHLLQKEHRDILNAHVYLQSDLVL